MRATRTNVFRYPLTRASFTPISCQDGAQAFQHRSSALTTSLAGLCVRERDTPHQVIEHAVCFGYDAPLECLDAEIRLLRAQSWNLPSVDSVKTG